MRVLMMTVYDMALPVYAFVGVIIDFPDDILWVLLVQRVAWLRHHWLATSRSPAPLRRQVWHMMSSWLPLRQISRQPSWPKPRISRSIIFRLSGPRST